MAKRALPLPDEVESSSLLKERLRPAISAAGGNAAFADRAGIPRDTFNKYLAGTQPPPSNLIRMADAANLTIDYLVGRTSADVVGSGLPLMAKERAELGEEFVVVPRLAVRASAGPGRITIQADLGSAEFAFRRSWLRSLGVAPQNAEFLVVDGDSMEPTIKDGDLVLVDRGFGEVVNGKIYVLLVNDRVLVKRVHLLAFGGAMLISDNERYPTETIPGRDMEGLNIEARVAWYGRAV